LEPQLYEQEDLMPTSNGYKVEGWPVI
jgi:hypothetical protein